jgi:hypothetical protein
MLEEAIRAFRAHRLADRDYLKQVMEIAESVRSRSGDHSRSRSGTATWRGRSTASYRRFYPQMPQTASTLRAAGADAALRIDEIIRGADRQLDDEPGRAEPDEERDRGRSARLKEEWHST